MEEKQLLEKFKDWIDQKKFLPGDRLPGEIELAAVFKVSRGSIREVISHFAFLGILERKTKSGTCLKAPTGEEIAESFGLQLKTAGATYGELKQARLLLETSVVPHLIHKITPLALDELERNVDRMEASAGNADLAEQLDLEFHRLLLGVCGNRVLNIIGGLLVEMFRAEYREPFRNRKAALKAVADHRKMLRYISAGEKEKLLELIESHIQPL